MTLGVDANWRGRGVAAALLERALDDMRAHGCVRAELHVQADNIAAMRLYCRRGFLPEEFCEDYYEFGAGSRECRHAYKMALAFGELRAPASGAPRQRAEARSPRNGGEGAPARNDDDRDDVLYS